MTESAVLTLAYILDLAIGDPQRLPHPVRIIGRGIKMVEQPLRSLISFITPRSLLEKLTGAILVLIIVGLTYGIFYFINLLLTSYFSILTFLILAYLISTTLATRELISSAQSVIKALEDNHIEEARESLSLIVGRDTRKLDRKGILKATIETVAENASDGIIAPLFYFLIAGLPLAMTYKAINTLDSMVGYKNEKYKNFGWAAARLDDIANFIPARITGVLIVISTLLITLLKNPVHALRITHHALRIMLRDGRNHPSPNSGIPEAAMAGALGVRLGGPSTYKGVLIEKPYIGEDKSEFRIQKSEVKDQMYDYIYFDASRKALSIVIITSLLGFGLALILLYLRTTT